MRRGKRLSVALVCGLALVLAGCGESQLAQVDPTEDLGVSLSKRRRRAIPPVATPPADTVKVVPPVVTPPTPTPPPVVTPPTPPAPPLPGGETLWGFAGSPATPIPFDEPGWDVQVYSRDRATWYAPEPLDGHHGADCAGYPAVHRITSYDQMVYRCRDHIMTAIRAEGYGAITLAPDRMLDLSAGEAVVRFDITTFKSSDRDWIHVWFSSFENHLVMPAADWAPGLNGPPQDGLYIEQTNLGNYCPRFVRNFVVTSLNCDDWQPLTNRIVASATRRNTLEIRLSNNRVKVSMPNDGIVFADVALPAPLPFSRSVVQFSHYSYNPLKNGGSNTPNSWHWDEIRMAPTVPFTIIRADRRFVDGTGGTVTFKQPAPAGAKMHFFATGMAPDVSFDGGATWRAPTLQNFKRVSDPEQQYWTPVPAGTTRVMVRPARTISWWTDRNSWMARDFAVWAQ